MGFLEHNRSLLVERADQAWTSLELAIQTLEGEHIGIARKEYIELSFQIVGIFGLQSLFGQIQKDSRWFTLQYAIGNPTTWALFRGGKAIEHYKKQSRLIEGVWRTYDSPQYDVRAGIELIGQGGVRNDFISNFVEKMVNCGNFTGAQLMMQHVREAYR